MTKMIDIVGIEGQSIHLTKATLNDQRFSVKFINRDISDSAIPIIHVTFDP